MGTIKVHEFTSLDGVIDNPSWTFDMGFDPRMGGAIGQLMGSCASILLGRRTFEMFEPAWSARTAEQDPGAPFMNDTMKHVVSSTLRATGWANSRVIGPYSAAAIRTLKESVEGGIYVSGSGMLVRALISDELADELHLFVYPITLGSGPRLFSDVPKRRWVLAECERFDNGVLYLVYTPARATT